MLETITHIDKVIEITIDNELAVFRISGRVVCENCKTGFNTNTELKPKINGICDNCSGNLIKREDDNEPAVIKRLETYYKTTKPILELYKGKIIPVDGNKNIQGMRIEAFEKLGIK